MKVASSWSCTCAIGSGMTAALMRFALGGSTNLPGRVSGRHASLPETHDTTPVAGQFVHESVQRVNARFIPHEAALDAQKTPRGLLRCWEFLPRGLLPFPGSPSRKWLARL